MSSRLRNLSSTKISFFAFQDIITSVSGILILVTLLLATDLDNPGLQSSSDLDLDLKRKLEETLRQQSEVNAQNADLQRMLADAQTAPSVEKIQFDIDRLRSQVDQEMRNQADITNRLAEAQSRIEARDRALGLSGLRKEIQDINQRTRSLEHEELDLREKMTNLEGGVVDAESKVLRLRERQGKLWLIPDRASTTKEPVLTTVSGNGIKIEQFDQPQRTKEFIKTSALTEFDSFLNAGKSQDQYIVFFVRPSGMELFDDLVKRARSKGFEVGFDALEEDRDIHFSSPPPLDEPINPSQESLNPASTAASSPSAPSVVDQPTPHVEVPASTNTPFSPVKSPPTKTRWQRLLDLIGAG